MRQKNDNIKEWILKLVNFNYFVRIESLANSSTMLSEPRNKVLSEVFSHTTEAFGHVAEDVRQKISQRLYQ